MVKRKNQAPKGRNIAGSLSPKILDQIFSNLEVFKPIFDFTPQRKFLRLLRVNRAWHTAALRHLYRTVAVGQEDDDDTRLLLRTLKRRPDIAALVQEARLGLYGYDQLPTKQHAKIINLCPNLTGLQVWGWNGGVLPILVDAIRSKKTLKKLNINRHTIRDTEGDAFCSPRELMEMMKGWPELERLHLHRRALDGLKDKDDDDPETDAPNVFPPETEVTNPKLRYIRFDDSITGFFDVNYFRDLGVIAPAVEHFTAGFFTYDSNQPRMASLKSCLSQWASTLQEVHITHHDNSRDSKPQARASIDDIFGSFSALRVLDIGPHFVLLSTVVEGSAPLEELYYEGDSTATKHLADQLQSPECLPRLRILQLKGHDIPATHRIRQVCAARGIKLNSLDSLDSLNYIKDALLNSMIEQAFGEEMQEEMGRYYAGNEDSEDSYASDDDDEDSDEDSDDFEDSDEDESTDEDELDEEERQRRGRVRR